MQSDDSRFLFAGWHPACLRQMRNHTREPSSEQLLPDSGADNASLVKELMMPTTDSIQTKVKRCEKAYDPSSVFSRAGSEEKSGCRLSVASARTSLDYAAMNEAITHMLVLFARELSFAAVSVCHISPGKRLNIQTAQAPCGTVVCE